MKQVTTALSAVPIVKLGVAVSGGGDSIALLRLLADWGQKNGCEIVAATVNHNLRAEAGKEAAFVATLCKSLNIPHSILNWDDWAGQGNLQNEARNARKKLLASWAKQENLSAVALGHTQDDQAETFLMRLARGSGVDGLSGIQQISGSAPVYIRPLLEISRQDLRSYLKDLGQQWIDDPSNDDTQFDRIKMRKAMPFLEALGLTTSRLAKTSTGLQSARDALEQITLKAARVCCELSEYGTVGINLDKLKTEPSDIQYRVISHAICWITHAHYRPRFASLKATYDLVKQGKSQTLAGCYIKSVSPKQIIVMRERAAMPTKHYKNGLYDMRWRVIVEDLTENAYIKPLGEVGLAQIDNWHELGVLRDILMQTPAIWQDGTVISAPLAGLNGISQIFLINDHNQFYLDIVSH